jgi:hypothetical protein
MSQPIICFGQQPCGFFPKRFLYGKIMAARQLQASIGGQMVFFYHDSDHDSRETTTILNERGSGREQALNFQFANKIQKQFSPLYAKRILPDWQTKMTQQLRQYVNRDLVEKFRSIEHTNPADFCLEMYRRIGLLDEVRVKRSSDPAFRKRAIPVDDYFVDVRWEDEIVRARYRDGKLLLHKGGGKWIELPQQDFDAAQISPDRDTRFRWMQSVIHCTHYVAGAGERGYLNESDAPEVQFVPRLDVTEPEKAYVPD